MPNEISTVYLGGTTDALVRNYDDGTALFEVDTDTIKKHLGL